MFRKFQGDACEVLGVGNAGSKQDTKADKWDIVCKAEGAEQEVNPSRN